MSRTRCQTPGCPRFAASDSVMCSGCARAIATAPPPIGGSVAGILGDELGQVIRDAGEHEPLDDELGALRYALAQVLRDVTDPVKLANCVARLTAATAQVARTRRQISGQAADQVTDAIEQILMEISR